MGHICEETVIKSLQQIQKIDEEERNHYSVDYIKEEITYDEFYSKYLLLNRPCVLGKWATKTWKSIRLWTSCSTEEVVLVNCPNFSYLKETFGSTIVPVADCKQKYYNSQVKEEWNFNDFLEYWENYRANGYPAGERSLYLKDWHFPRFFKDYCAYEVPAYFKSDWVNEFWDDRNDSQNDDYRFVYMGPKGSWTPFHADVYRSYSWSANICGKKKWILYAPGNEEYLKDKQGILAFDVLSASLNDPAVYPKAALASTPITVIQEEGEIIFVPSGWHHQVHNLEDTISINHNWLNACNISETWKFLESEMELVKKEIQDCQSSMTRKEWINQCQVIMKANTGIDFEEFLAFLTTIACPRIAMLRKIFKNKSSCICKECKLQVAPLSCVVGSAIGNILLSVERSFSVEYVEASGMLMLEKCSVCDCSCTLHAIVDLYCILIVLCRFLSNRDLRECEGVCGSLCEDSQLLMKKISLALKPISNGPM